jgi:hypothetical protein
VLKREASRFDGCDKLDNKEAMSAFESPTLPRLHVRLKTKEDEGHASDESLDSFL